MKLSEMINELESIQGQYGDIIVQIQETPSPDEPSIIGHEGFFIVPELYDDDGWICNLRIWPY